MNKDEFIELAKRLAKMVGSTKKAAELMGVSLRTFEYWLAGDVEPRGPAKKLIKKILEELEHEVAAKK